MIIPRKSRQQLHGVGAFSKFTPIDRRLITRIIKDITLFKRREKGRKMKVTSSVVYPVIGYHEQNSSTHVPHAAWLDMITTLFFSWASSWQWYIELKKGTRGLELVWILDSYTYWHWTMGKWRALERCPYRMCSKNGSFKDGIEV